MSSKKLTKSQLKRLYGLLSPACSGKTTLFKELKECLISSKSGTQYINIDIDEVTFKDLKPDGADEKLPPKEQTFPKRRDAIQTILSDFPKYKVIIFTSDAELLKYLGLESRHIKVFVHSSVLFLSYISPLLNFPQKDDTDADDTGKEEDKDNGKDTDDNGKSEGATGIVQSNSSSASPAGPRRRPGKSSSALSGGEVDINPAESIPARLVSHIESLTNHTVTIDGINGVETADISFKTETLTICKSRDYIMKNYEYQLYNSIKEFKKLVAEAFKLVIDKK